MAVRVTTEVVPGVGLRHDLTLDEGHRLGVVVRRDGGHDLVVAGENGSEVSVRLGQAEADAVAELLGGPKVVKRLTALQRAAAGVLTEQLPMPKHSPYSGRPLSDTRARTRTRASIVAVMRGGATQPSPAPDFVLEGGDLVVAIGTRESLDQLAHILDGTG
ncbi:cation:proton antiporter regulatory subunit [uncultured Jatrophihabitans sp.]|uniref:cation:proton antiporter regulatory subunit n=1 Tax=uncultured Jatrophihabitans sp. TaxID=1610747 RepID=UPI0035C95547